MSIVFGMIKSLFFGNSASESEENFGDDAEGGSNSKRASDAYINMGGKQHQQQQQPRNVYQEQQYDRMEHNFFKEYEKLHRFPQGTLEQFYCSVLDRYRIEIEKVQWQDESVAIQQFDNFISQYLSYLYYTPDVVIATEELQYDQSGDTTINMITTTTTTSTTATTVQQTSPLLTCVDPFLFPAITLRKIFTPINKNNNEDKHCMLVEDTECDVFMIKSKMDFVYSYVFEKCIIDAIQRKVKSFSPHYAQRVYEELCGRNSSLNQQRSIYRSFKRDYFACDDPSNVAHQHTQLQRHCPYEWGIIYTHKSSLFYKQCYERIMTSQTFFELGRDYLMVESIPFQQVLFFCSEIPGFLEKYTFGIADSGDSFQVNPLYIHDWVALPSVWYYLIWQVCKK